MSELPRDADQRRLAVAFVEKERLQSRRREAGEIVAALRSLHGLSQTQLAEEVETTKRVVQEVEAGRRSLRAEELPRWGAALKVPAESFATATHNDVAQLRAAVVDIKRAKEKKEAYLLAAREWEAVRRQAQLVLTDKHSLPYRAARRTWGEEPVIFLQDAPTVEWRNDDGGPYVGPLDPGF